MPHVKVYAVINQKGGVGKTTTVANLGAVIASRGHKTCLIDLDPQAHLTLHFGIDSDSVKATTYDVLVGQTPLESAAITVTPQLSVVPSIIDLAAAEVELVSKVGREQILRDRLSASPPGYELVMIDCPPSLGLLTLNALAAADAVLIPLQPHFLALQGLGRLFETILLVKERINPALKVAGVIFCMYETTTRLAAEVAADLEQFIDAARDSDMPWSDARIFTQRIRRNIKLAECPSHGKTIFDYDPHSLGAEDYIALADEFLAGAFGRSAGLVGEPVCDDQSDASLADNVSASPQIPQTAAGPPATVSVPPEQQADQSPAPTDPPPAISPACGDQPSGQPESVPDPAPSDPAGQI